jgi:Tol biopolymer transport system component
LLAEGGRDPRFSPDGTRVAYWQGEPYTGSGAQVFIVAADGGPPERAAAAFSDARYPIWSPDSTQLALVGSYNNRRDWWVQPLDGNRPTAMGGYEILRMQGFRVDASAPGALAAPSVWQNDAILFASVSGETASLWRAPYSAGMGQVTGSAERLTFGNGWDSQPSASENGKVVFSGSTIDLDIWSAPLNANTGKVQGNLQRVVQGGGRDYQPSISRDGTRLVYRSNRNGQECIWVKDLVSGKEMEHCDNHLENIPASISPSGTRIAYRARGRVHAMNPDGSEDRFICRGCRPWGWFPDDKQLLVQYGSRRVSVIAEGEPESREVLRGEDHALSEAHPSPDGKWIAFHQIMGPNGRQVFVAPFAEKESVRQKEWIPITGESANDRNAQWSPDGNLLYFLSERDGFRCVWAQRLDPRTKRPRGGPFGVQHFHHARLSLMHGTNPGDIGLSVARDRLVLSVFERTGNIWMLRAER